jgi:hypothetical protein
MTTTKNIYRLGVPGEDDRNWGECIDCGKTRRKDKLWWTEQLDPEVLGMVEFVPPELRPTVIATRCHTCMLTDDGKWPRTPRGNGSLVLNMPGRRYRDKERYQRQIANRKRKPILSAYPTQSWSRTFPKKRR